MLAISFELVAFTAHLSMKERRDRFGSGGSEMCGIGCILLLRVIEGSRVSGVLVGDIAR